MGSDEWNANGAAKADPWQVGEDPWGGSPDTVKPHAAVASGSSGGAPAGGVEGRWEDTWGTDKRPVVITMEAGKVTVKWPEYDPEESTFENGVLKVPGMNLEAKLSGDELTFATGPVWVRVGTKAKDGAAGAPAAAGDKWAAEKPADGKRDAEPQNTWSNYSAGAGAADASGEKPPEDREVTKKRRWKDFQFYQDENTKNNTLPGKSWGEEAADEDRLFSQDAARETDFSLYENVPVVVKQPKEEENQVAVNHYRDFQSIFDDFTGEVPDELINNIKKCGYTCPTPVQRNAIPLGLAGRDIMCCAQTGSGKTAAFLIPLLAGLMKHGSKTGALETPFTGPCKPDTLVMSPTRELCLQIFNEAEKFFHKTGHRAVRVYGQENIGLQIKELAKGCDLCVATPGRMWDFVSAGIIDVSCLNCLVFDEADRMLQMQMDCYLKELIQDFNMPTKDDRQTMMFSATFNPDCQKMAEEYLFKYIFIGIGSVGSAASTVHQNFQKVESMTKPDSLVSFINSFLQGRAPGERLLVFTNSKLQAKGLDEKLYDQDSIDSGSLHGDLTQAQREENLQKFREGKIDVMIATDLASRGLDIEGVSQVLNYDLPFSIDVYVHRIGRTGRIGQRGIATTFVCVDGRSGELMDNKGEQLETLNALPEIVKGSNNVKNTMPDWLTEMIAKNAPAAAWGAKKWDPAGDGGGPSAWGGWQAPAEAAPAASEWKNDSQGSAAPPQAGSWDDTSAPAGAEAAPAAAPRPDAAAANDAWRTEGNDSAWSNTAQTGAAPPAAAAGSWEESQAAQPAPAQSQEPPVQATQAQQQGSWDEPAGQAAAAPAWTPEPEVQQAAADPAAAAPEAWTGDTASWKETGAAAAGDAASAWESKEWAEWKAPDDAAASGGWEEQARADDSGKWTADQDNAWKENA